MALIYVYLNIYIYITTGILTFKRNILSGKCSDIVYGILSGIYSDILSCIYSDIPSGNQSSIYSGILSSIYSGILSDILSSIHSGSLSGILSGMSSGPRRSTAPRYAGRSRPTPQPPELGILKFLCSLIPQPCHLAIWRSGARPLNSLLGSYSTDPHGVRVQAHSPASGAGDMSECSKQEGAKRRRGGRRRRGRRGRRRGRGAGEGRAEPLFKSRDPQFAGRGSARFLARVDGWKLHNPIKISIPCNSMC